MIRTITTHSLWDSVRTQKQDFWRANIFGIAATLIFLPIPILIPLLIDEVLLDHPAHLTETIFFIFGSKEEWLMITMVLFSVLFLRILAFLLNNSKTFFTLRIVQKSAYSLRHMLLHHLERISMTEYETLKSGAVASKTVHDVENISGFMGMAVTTALTSGLMFFGIAAVMLWISWPLAVLVFILNPLFLGFSRILGRKAGALLQKQHEAYELYQDLLSETLELFVQVRASNQERSFFGLLQTRAKVIEKSSLDYGHRSSVAQTSSTLLTNSVVDLFRALGIAAVAYTDLTIGMMLGFLFYLSNLVSPVNQLMSLVISFQSVKPSIHRLNGLLALKHEPHYPHLQNPFEENVTTSVELKHIGFAYDNGKKVLHDISLKAETGQKIALIGPSGGGKTTLAQLMVGFYTPETGQVLYGGVPIEKIGLPVVRENVALMLQQSLFFNDTIRMNLTLGKAIENESIFKALDMAQLGGFIRGLEEGLESRIGKNGIRLSGGQRQRLAIARLILSDPKIVIFDEATSALDNDTEHRLYETLELFLKARTTIIIAHRETTIRQADRIFYVDEGKVLAEGTYAKMCSEKFLSDEKSDLTKRCRCDGLQSLDRI